MNNNRAHQQKPAGVIRYSCGILFMLFSFCYLFFLQGELLAEAQYVYSQGITTYNVLIGALIISIILQVVQWIVCTLSRLPARWHALSYLPSMLFLTILTDVDRDSIHQFSFGAWLWIVPLVLVVYVIAVVVIRCFSTYENSEFRDLRSLLYPNYIILFCLILAVGSIPQSTDVYHYELKAERLILEKDYEGALRVGKGALRSSARLTQLRMYALSKQGQLAERMFDYPQHYGSQGLLDVTDTLSDYRFDIGNICFHLGAFCGKSIHTTQRYYELVLADSIWNKHTADYYLCSLLLDKRLKEFLQVLPHYYNLADSIPNAYDYLPRAYREALLLVSPLNEAQQGKIVVGTDTLATLSDTVLIQRFRDYCTTKICILNLVERINKTHRLFGNTYWWYYDYSQQACGELKKMD